MGEAAGSEEKSGIFYLGTNARPPYSKSEA